MVKFSYNSLHIIIFINRVTFRFWGHTLDVVFDKPNGKMLNNDTKTTVTHCGVNIWPKYIFLNRFLSLHVYNTNPGGYKYLFEFRYTSCLAKKKYSLCDVNYPTVTSVVKKSNNRSSGCFVKKSTHLLSLHILIQNITKWSLFDVTLLAEICNKSPSSKLKVFISSHKSLVLRFVYIISIKVSFHYTQTITPTGENPTNVFTPRDLSEF